MSNMSNRLLYKGYDLTTLVWIECIMAFIMFYLFIYLLVLYKAEKPASKVCGQPVPTARKYSVHT